MPKLINEIRFFHFISGLLHQQQSDPLCRDCKAFVNTAGSIKEGLAELQSLLAGKTDSVAPELYCLADEAGRRLEGLRIPQGAEGQKKAGRCRMPEGVCFIKYSKAIRDRL